MGYTDQFFKLSLYRMETGIALNRSKPDLLNIRVIGDGFAE